jgi:hypothetical protein
MRLRRRLETPETEAESLPSVLIDRLIAVSAAAAQPWMKIFF